MTTNMYARDHEKIYKIDDVSRMTGYSQKRIRDYEKEGLIKPAREPNTNDRLFSQFDVKQINWIKHLIHRKGFTIPALKQLLTVASGGHNLECQQKKYCWTVLECPQRENCEVFKNRHKRCWEIQKRLDKVRYQQFCTTCPLYLVRITEQVPLLG